MAIFARSSLRLLVAASGCLATLFTVPALAQLEEIVVTAERREGDIQEVPLAVSAFGVEQIERLQISQAADLQRYVPSLNMFNNITHPSNLSLSLRGGLQQDASLVVAESPIGIYIDDIYIARLNANNVTLSDIERVEVLRGPQGTLYGRNTGYGAIKFITRNPGEDVWFNATAGVGNEDQLLFKASAGGPIGKGFAASLSGQYKEKGGEWFNVTENVDTGEEKNTAIRGKLRYIGSERLDAVLSVSWSKAENDSLQLVNGITPNVPANRQFTTDDLVFPNGEWAVATPFGQLDPPPLKDRPQAETEQFLVGFTLSYDISDRMTLKSITGFLKTEDFFHTDFKGDGTGFTGASEAEANQFSQELQLLGNAMDQRLNYIVGLYFLNEDSDQTFGWHFVTPLSQSLIQVETDSFAIFGQADYHLTDRLKFTAGLRYTKDDKKFEFDFERLPTNIFNVIIPPGGLFPPIMERITSNDSFEDVTPKFGLDYTLQDVGVADSLLFYVQAAKGFKGGGYSAIALVSTDPVGVYQPETNWTYEGGIKADWFDNRLRTNLALFFSDIEDIQQNSTANAAPGAFEFPVDNVADAEIKGLEFELSFFPIQGLNIFASGALLDGEYKNLKPGGAAANAPADFGVEAQTPQTPDYQINVGASYTFDFPGELIGDVVIGADYYTIDEYVTAATNDFRNSGWDIWNAFISADIGDNWQAKLTGKNLADDFIITSGSRGLGGFVALPPREYLFTLSYHYGK